jgi:hypothetical protein
MISLFACIVDKLLLFSESATDFLEASIALFFLGRIIGM